MGEVILDLEDAIRRLEAEAFKMERELRATRNDAKLAREYGTEAIQKHQQLVWEIEELRDLFRKATEQA